MSLNPKPETLSPKPLLGVPQVDMASLRSRVSVLEDGPLALGILGPQTHVCTGLGFRVWG